MEKQLVKYSKEELVKFYSDGGLEPVLNAIKKEASLDGFNVEDKEGRAGIKSLAHKVARSKTFIDDIGKNMVSEWKTKAKAVDQERKKAREFLDQLKEEIRRPVTEWENREKEEQERIEKKIEEIKAYRHSATFDQSSKEIEASLKEVQTLEIDETFGDMIDKAKEAKALTIEILQGLLVKKIQREKELEELEALRKEKEERDKRDYEEKLKREAAEKAKKEAEEKAEKEKEEMRLKIEAQELERKREQEKIKRLQEEKEQAVIRAKEEAARQAEEERKRIESERLKREADLKHTIAVNDKILKAMIGKFGIEEEKAKALVSAIAKGEIENIFIKY